MMNMNQWRRWILLTAAAVLAGCGGGDNRSSPSSPPLATASMAGETSASATAVSVAAETAGGEGMRQRQSTTSNADQTLSPAARIGKLIFFEKQLSGRGDMACATCHDPVWAFSDTVAQMAKGGLSGQEPATRSTPALRYRKFVPENFNLDAGVPVGGLFWDGRSSGFHSTAIQPFFNPREMALKDIPALRAKLVSSGIMAEMANFIRPEFLRNDPAMMSAVSHALSSYLRDGPDAELAPFTSKFDKVMRGQAAFTESERLGFEFFKDPERGNCAGCHAMNIPVGSTAKGALFTDNAHRSVLAPRNHRLPDVRNNPTGFYDMGVCDRRDFLANSLGLSAPNYCTAFRTPSLRNVATTAPYFHNGVFNTLEEVVRFYLTRDNPRAGHYKKANGSPDIMYNDIAPWADRTTILAVQGIRPGVGMPGAPFGRGFVTDAEVVSLVDFLKTLTDEDVPSR